MRTLEAITEDMESWTTSRRGDPEIAHSEADDLLVEAVKTLAAQAGRPLEGDALIDAWERVPKWYA